MKRTLEHLIWNIEEESCDLRPDRQVYTVSGWIVPANAEKLELQAELVGSKKPLSVKTLWKQRRDVEAVHPLPQGAEGPGFVLTVEGPLSEMEASGEELAILACSGGIQRCLCMRSFSSLRKLYYDGNLFYKVEWIRRMEDNLVIGGWSFSRFGRTKLELRDSAGRTVACKVERRKREDVLKYYGAAEQQTMPGFRVTMNRKALRTKNCTLIIRDAWTSKEETVEAARFFFEETKAGRFWKYLEESSRVRENIRYIREHSLEEYRYESLRKLYPRVADYELWRWKHVPGSVALARQRLVRFRQHPKFSIVIPLYNTPIPYLEELLDSIAGQTYRNWELCLADGSTKDEVGEWIHRKYGREPRVIYHRLEKNSGISENTNCAMRMATGDYIVLADHDDVIEKNALYEMAAAIEKNPAIDVLYTDEDKVNENGKRYCEPNFKPDFNWDYLRSTNYICHLFAVRREIVKNVGLLRPEYDGAQDYDFILRCCEKASVVWHIPKVLYHWRRHAASTAGNPRSKLYAYEAGRRAVEAHYQRTGLEASVTMTEFYGHYRTQYRLPEPPPLVSILIPNKDHTELLEACLSSLYGRTRYRNFEVLVIENNSVEEDTFLYYRDLESRYERLRVLRWEGEFNFSAINNYAAGQAGGEYLLLLNNDVEIRVPEWLDEMVGYCQRPDVGAVGAQLLYNDEVVQHAGVIVGLGDSRTAGHITGKINYLELTYQEKLRSAQDLSAVTGACLLTKKSLYEELGGLDEERFGVAFNDVDYCLRLREKGYLVVYDGFVTLYHRESVTRGRDTQPGNVRRFEREAAAFRERWAEILRKGDPCYNPNLTLDGGYCTVRIKKA